ncbi:MAG: DUF2993 domain-containing protein [Rhodoglobus sp.]
MAEPIAERPAPSSPVDTVPLPRVVVVEQPPKKKRRRGLGWLIALVVVAILLVVGYFVAEAYAKQYAIGYVQDQVRAVLGLDAKTPVDVDLGDGSVIFQAIGGSVHEVNVTVDELSFGGITGTAHLNATDVPLDSSKPVGTLGIDVTVTEKNVRKLADFLSGSQLKSIDVGNGVITIGSEFSVFGLITIPVGVDLKPSAADGGINFEPQTVTLGDNDISVADLRNNPAFSAVASQFLQSRQFCVAQYLPEALKVSDVKVVGSDLVVSINGDGTALGGKELSTLGTCPGSGQ